MYEELLKKFNLTHCELFSYKGNRYMVNSDGIYKMSAPDEWDRDTELMADMLVGNIDSVKMWRPKGGTDYYIFNTAYNKIEKIGWLNSELDNWRFESGLVCQTKEEAEKLGKKIINYLKQEY